MGLDSWLEKDITAFLDTEASTQTAPSVAPRLEDTAAIYQNLDWKAEITKRIAHGDIAGAKQLFAQLRLRYASTPQEHTTERGILFATMRDCYTVITNRVLDDWHTRALIGNVDTNAENIFDESVKPVDLSKVQTQDRAIIPDVPLLTPALAEHAEPFRRLREEKSGATDELFNFDPKRLIETIEQAAAHASAAADAPSQKAEAPRAASPAQRALTEAIAIATSDPKRARALLLPLVTDETPDAIRTPAKRLLAALAPHIEPVAALREAQHLTIPVLQRLRIRGTVTDAELATLRARFDAIIASGAPIADEARRIRMQLDALSQGRTRPLFPSTTATATAPAPTPTPTNGFIDAVRALRAAAVAHDRPGVIAALDTLERVSTAFPEVDRVAVTAAVAALRTRIGGTA